ncbi:CRISPR-associated helicase Cas3' [Vagococcus acidifermentans]|uniref:CRISPR-associated helicase/endonuclease Cas3 n=1 Tax=Vagococcus acidifermentans TaxID=564710 RepID=A0A430AR48_9ENTE|nr:CRISPR-associated helicase Cas3' [Vagococcus acidifermentans]RSU10473.1 hypothetical protein CBF27_10710 [Vagococcus acidifermentans]
MKYVAHIRKKDGEPQLVKDHLLEVKALSEEAGAKIGVKYLAGLAGVLHDVGKYSDEFQDYLREAVSNPDKPPKRGSVDHSTAGGRVLLEVLNQSVVQKMIAEMVGNVIISHHGGLNDYITPVSLETPYYRRVYEKELQEFERLKQRFFDEVISREELRDYCAKAEAELAAFINKSKEQRSDAASIPRDIDLLTKFLFSCLIDADRTNTRLFEENTEKQAWHSAQFFSESLNKLNYHLSKFEQGAASQQPINILRRQMSQQALEFASRSSGIYQLSIPTGGGKTLASLRYALKHAETYQKERIIYVVPFTTIIEQNAQVIREIVGDEYLLEHHSNVIEDDFTAAEYEAGFQEDRFDLKLAKDNWDAPIILTTMVQYLNVFYSRGTRNVRRLHNLVNATVIFDEVQAVPIKCLSLFNESVNFLKNYGQTSLLLCTATQPALDYVSHGLELPKEPEIIQNLPQVVEAFKRVEIVDKTKKEPWHLDDIVTFSQQLMTAANSLLIVLNTKKAVRAVYKQLVAENKSKAAIYHLSTSMCPKHRKQQLEEMIKLMKDNQRVICVSSQLIEAGVDISFNHVIRSLAGLDSIAQAAGRCNRHGSESIREVYVINVSHALENTDKLPEIQRGAAITGKLLRSLASGTADLLSPNVMMRYFQEYYSTFRTDSAYYVKCLETNLFDLLGANTFLLSSLKQQKGLDYPLFLSSSMKTIGQYFKVIDNQTTSVFVPYNEEARNIIGRLNGDPELSELTQLLKQAQQYSVNLYNQEIDQLSQKSLLLPLYRGHGYYLADSAYDKTYGVNLEGSSQMGTLIFE